MGNVRVRYLVERRHSRRPTSYYWMPTGKLIEAGFSPRRLSNIKAEAVAQAEVLNARLDAWYRGETRPLGPAPGTLAAVNDAFQRDDAFLGLAERTKRDYLYCIKSALTWAGDAPVTHLTRRAIKAWYHDQRDTRGPSNARNAIAALRRLLSYAKSEDMIERNPAT